MAKRKRTIPGALNRKRERQPLSAQITPVVWREAGREFFACITRDIAKWAVRDDLSMGILWCGQDALIDRLRSMTVSDWHHRSQHDVLLMIDHDTTWEAGDIERICRSALETRGVVGGMVPKRGKGMGLAGFPAQRIHPEPGSDSLLPATYVGGAFMAIHRDAITAIVEKHKMRECVGFSGVAHFYPLFLPFTIESKAAPGMLEYLSEDYAFCVRAITAGVPVYLDQKPILGHVGEHRFSQEEALDGAAAVGGVDPLGMFGE